MRGSLLRTLLALILLLAGIIVPVTVQAGVRPNSGTTITDKTDYFIGEHVQARFVIEYNGPPPNNLSMTFEWFTPASVMMFSETMDMDPFQINSDTYLATYSNWTSSMTGIGFRVKGTHNDSGESDESYFNVSYYEEAVYVESLTLSLDSNFYENNTVARATTTLGYLGNGTLLKNVSFIWNYPNGTEAFNKTVPPFTNETNSSVQAFSNWTVDFEGPNFEVMASYEGVAPLSDTAYFDVIPRRVKTWKNQSITSNDEWNLTDSPFGVCANITVQEGVRLVIPAGSTVRFCPDAGLFVRGTLMMEGFPTSNITLTSYPYPPSKGDWKGVFFENSGSDSSVLNNVKVNFSQQGIVLDRASPSLANITIANSSSTGIDVYQTVVSLSGIVVIDSGQGVFAFESTLNLMDSEILRCNDGVVVDDTDGTFERNHIFAISGRGIWASGSSLTIKDNVISAVDNGIRLESSQDFLVEGSTINADVFAFWISLSTNLTFSWDTISSGILFFTTTHDVLMMNSTITSSPENFRVSGGSTVTALNCSFDDTLVAVSSGSWLYVQNFLDVWVYDTDGQPLAGSSVQLILDQVPILPKFTDSGGWVKWQVVLYETFSGPGNPTLTSIQLNVTLDRYNITNNLRTVHMSVSHTEEFEGYLAFVPNGGNGGDDLSAQLLMIAIILPIVVVLLAILLALWAKRRKKRREEPEPSDEVSEPFEFKPEEGKGYILAEDGRKRSFETLISEMEEGSNGLCFTRTYPPNLKKQYDLSGAKVHWLSRDFDKGGMVPTNLGAIFSQVEKFLSENKGGRNFILIDGLEYLIAQNDFRKVLKLIHSLTDSVGVGRTTLLIPFNLQSLDERQAALISGDLEVVR